jgi:CMP/dCMP kinase
MGISGSGTQPFVMPALHIAIDGPVGSGKTTVAHDLARRLGILYLDTGAGVDPADEQALLALVRAHPVHVAADQTAPLGFRIYAGEEELGEGLYDNDVSAQSSVAAAHPSIREELLARQREIAQGGAVVMAGRDIGTVVLPDAGLKIFLTASVDARVRRRLAELAEQGAHIDPAVLRAQVIERDRLDANRPISPLRAAPDAIEIDSSAMSAAEVIEYIVSLVLARR